MVAAFRDWVAYRLWLDPAEQAAPGARRRLPWTEGLREILANEGSQDDLIAFMQDKMLPVEEIEAARIA